ncbi:hypothetical protein L9F63_000095, partial [Diploptera punctata]
DIVCYNNHYHHYHHPWFYQTSRSKHDRITSRIQTNLKKLDIGDKSWIQLYGDWDQLSNDLRAPKSREK